MKRLLLFVFILVGCGDSATEPTPAPTYESIAGNYAGTLTGEDLVVEFILTLSQAADGKLFGESASVTEFSDGTFVAGEGSFTGSIAAGENPAVTLNGGETCGVSNDWTGLFDSAGGKLTLSGTLIYSDETCTILLTYPATLVLTVN